MTGALLQVSSDSVQFVSFRPNNESSRSALDEPFLAATLKMYLFAGLLYEETSNLKYTYFLFSAPEEILNNPLLLLVALLKFTVGLLLSMTASSLGARLARSRYTTSSSGVVAIRFFTY
ncbi:hypothetical protein D3C79_990380 [compost metagenome]